MRRKAARKRNGEVDVLIVFEAVFQLANALFGSKNYQLAPHVFDAVRGADGVKVYSLDCVSAIMPGVRLITVGWSNTPENALLLLYTALKHKLTAGAEHTQKRIDKLIRKHTTQRLVLARADILT